jgi:hypothetical protein
MNFVSFFFGDLTGDISTLFLEQAVSGYKNNHTFNTIKYKAMEVNNIQ